MLDIAISCTAIPMLDNRLPTFKISFSYIKCIPILFFRCDCNILRHRYFQTAISAARHSNLTHSPLPAPAHKALPSVGVGVSLNNLSPRWFCHRLLNDVFPPKALKKVSAIFIIKFFKRNRLALEDQRNECEAAAVLLLEIERRCGVGDGETGCRGKPG